MAIRWAWAFVDLPAEGFEVGLEFWSRVTGTTRSARWGERSEFCTLLPPRGDAHVALQSAGGPGGSHLDLEVDDLAAETERVLVAGAAAVRTETDLHVMRSPGGLEFCLTDSQRARTRSAPATAPNGGTSAVDQVCLDIPEEHYDREVGFWTELTGWRFSDGGRPEFNRLTPDPSIPVQLLLQRLGEPVGQVRAHPDLACSDRELLVDWHTRSGAELVRTCSGWSVMRDPTGTVYCLTDRVP